MSVLTTYPRPKGLRVKNPKSAIIALILLLAITSCAISTIGNARLGKERAYSAELLTTVERLEDRGAMQSSEIDSLRDENVRLTDDIEELTVENDVLKAEEEKAYRDSITPQSSDKHADELITLAWDGEPAPAFTVANGWNAKKTRDMLAHWCDKYGISGSDKTWLVSKGTSIAYRESRHNPKAKNGDCLGLFQFDSGWGSKANRLDGSWSCRRFVKCFKQGGKAAIKKHWGATW